MTANAHFRFVFAHLALCAAAIFARPSALILRLPVLRGLYFTVGGALAVVPVSRPFACSRRAISASMVWIIADVSMVEIIANRLTDRPIDCDRPTKVLDVTDDQPFRIQLRFAHLSRKNYGELRQNQYAHHKRRFSKHSSSILSGEGFDERERGESLFVLA